MGLLDNGLTNTKVAVGLGAAAVGGIAGGLGVAALVGNSKKRKKISHTNRGWKQDRARRSKQPWEVAYQKRKRKKARNKRRSPSHSRSKRKHSSKRGVKYTKNGQPYIILSTGKARFIKRKRRAK
jgi:hypothetical protein